MFPIIVSHIAEKEKTFFDSLLKKPI